MGGWRCPGEAGAGGAGNGGGEGGQGADRSLPAPAPAGPGVGGRDTQPFPSSRRGERRPGGDLIRPPPGFLWRSLSLARPREASHPP